MTDKKYTLVESFFIFVFGGIFGTAFIAMSQVVALPVEMLAAWIRWKLWEWFAITYFHAPAVPYWTMFGIGLLIVSFMPASQPNG